MIRTTFQNDKEMQAKLKKLIEKFPDDVRNINEIVARVSVETYIKKNDIPIDTGRLRASITTKTIKDQTHTYHDDEGNEYDGSLRTNIDENSVVVGTNVVYANKMNRLGGGGAGSKRTDLTGQKRGSGYGQGFFDKGVKNGEIQLEKRLRKLINDLGDSL